MARLLLPLVASIARGADTGVIAPVPGPGSRDFVAGELRIVRHDAFEPESVGVFAPLARIGNALHLTTREDVVRDLLLFRPGERVTLEKLRESERLLRRSGLFRTASIRTDGAGDSARVEVVTRDVWSTRAVARFSSVGGSEELTIGLVETNFLGRGDALSWFYEWSDEADAYQVGVVKRRFPDVRSSVRLSYSEGEAGVSRQLGVTRPFYAISAPWTGGASGGAFRGRVWLYRGGEKSGRYALEQDVVVAHGSIYRGRKDRFQIGLGLSLDDRQSRALEGDALTFEEPLRNDRRRAVAIGVGWLRRRHVVLRGVDGSGVAEDHALGNLVSLVAGGELESLGSTRDRPYLGVSWTRSERLGRFEYASVRLRAAGRWSDAAPDGRDASGTLEVFGQRWPGSTLVLRALARWGDGHSPEEVFYVGAREGLRGFPSRAFRGDRGALANIEGRMHPGVDVLGLDVGFAVFSDAGVAWEKGTAARWRDLRTDVGAGLRVRNARLFPATFRLDVARGFGFDGGWQFTFSAGQAFSLIQRLDFSDPVPDSFGGGLE